MTKTTIAGLCTLVAAAATAAAHMLDADPNTVADWGAVVALVLTSFGLFAAGDKPKQPGS